MKELVIGMTIGFLVGIVVVKTCKPVAELAEKTKKAIKGKMS